MAGGNFKPGERRFDRLPWLIGAGGFLLYLVTLNPWVSLSSIGTIARTSGWLWQPQLERPLTFALLAPFRLLPEAWLPVVLNIFTAVCASLVLVLLARSVALLPHDVNPNQPFPREQAPAVLSIPMAWLPPLLAAILCGLQLTFWEHATSASGEMIDLLVFAYVIRCLLEFRVDQKQSWLARAAFVYGLGMTSSWALIGFFPVFIAAILRLKGYGPFRRRNFLLRMSLWGLAGLSLYLLLPTMQILTPHSDIGFWTALKAHLRTQKEILSYFRRPSFQALVIASLLPVVVLSIRWKSHTIQFGDDSRLGVFLTKSAVHLLHGLFFFSSLWLALDPTFSPRHLRFGIPMLTFYYLSALVFGYCAGYFLLLRSTPQAAADVLLRPGQAVWWNKLNKAMDRHAPGMVRGGAILGLVCLPVVFIWRNFPQIRVTNGSTLRQFAAVLYADLPDGKSIVLSDDPAELLFLRAEVSAHHYEKDALLLEAPSLVSAQYRRFVARPTNLSWPTNWPTNENEAAVKVLETISGLSSRVPVIHLQPGFGIWFEYFGEKPVGCVRFLKSHNTRATPEIPASSRDENANRLASLSDDEILRNDLLWQKRWADNLQMLAEPAKPKPKTSAGALQTLLRRLYLTTEKNPTRSFVGAVYSRRLNDWGVQSQRFGRPEAAVWYQRALDLNPDNIAARINLTYAERCQRGDKSPLNVTSIQKEFSGLFANYESWRDVIRANGPVDEPSFLLQTGRVLLAGGNNRQALASFKRCAALAQTWLAAKYWVTQSYIKLRDFEHALETADSMQLSQPLDGPGLSSVLECRVMALRGLGRTNDATACLESFIAQSGDHTAVLSVAADLYSQAGQFEKEVAILDDLLQREARRPDLICRKGLAQMELARYDDAIKTLTSALTLAPRNENARLLRAVACLGADKFEEARADYEALVGTAPNGRIALFGLGTVAWRQQNTNAAIRYYQEFLSNGLGRTRQDLLALERLSQLQGSVAVKP